MDWFPEDRSFTQAALDAVSRAGMAPVDMRHFSAREGSPADYCRERVRECEIYVAVVGLQYGSLVPGEEVSFTELEFEQAAAVGVPRLVFLLDETAFPHAPSDVDRGLVNRFRQRLRNADLVVRTFTSSDRLELEVFHALTALAREVQKPASMAQPSRTSASILSPTIATVPRIWNVPNRNADFTGREVILEKLHDDLAGDGRAVVLARAVYGLGGVGKTQLVLEYAHRFQADYDLIWWIDAEQPLEISLALADLAGRLGLPTSDNAAESAAAALEQLRRGVAGRWLLIFDNAEDPEDLAAFLPAGSGHIIITSRNRAWTRHAGPVELDVFSQRESVVHLMRHVPGLDDLDATRVSRAVGNLPLAIEQAAAWLAETGMPAGLYAEWLETQATSALGLNKPLDYAKPVVAAWNLSISRLRERSPASIRLLQILAFCSPGPISATLLYSDAMINSLRPYDIALSKPMLSRVIGEISRFALVKVDQSSNPVQIHRLVQEVIRSQMNEEEQVETRHRVHEILSGARPSQGDTDDPANWSTYDIIWPHLSPSVAEECDDPRTRQLLIDWVRYQWKHGEFEAGLALAKRLENLWSHELGSDHQQTLHLQFQIANVLRSQGRFEEARDLDTYVLERQRMVLGPDHPHALMTANGLSADLRALGEFQKSLTLDQATYESFRDQFGQDYPRTLVAGHNLGCSLRLIGDCFTARRLDEETLIRQRQVLGREHPDTLLLAGGLALDLRAAGAFRESVTLLRDTWAKYREVLGDGMTETLLTAASLAVSLRKAGEQSEAMALALDTYERYEQRYGFEAPDALSCALNLACDYAATGDIPRALDLVRGVKAAYQSDLGRNHPNTLVAANNLACYLRRNGQFHEALTLMTDTLARMRHKLGENHPLTLSCAVNLASCQGDSGDPQSAETLHRQTGVLLNEVLGRDHPDTLVCEANLAVTMRQAGRTEEAEQQRMRTIESISRILGPQHPDEMLLRDWRRIDLDLEAVRI
jgi:tetratricopeptide (TPR) repeat protein